MQPFVCGRVDCFQVFDPVIELVMISMVDLMPGWNGSEVGLPHQHVFHAQPF